MCDSELQFPLSGAASMQIGKAEEASRLQLAEQLPSNGRLKNLAITDKLEIGLFDRELDAPIM
jgi:hypothetical protein